MNWENLKRQLLENEEFKKEYSKYDLAFEIGEMVTDARVKLGLTQAQLADLAETQQPSIARLENGTTLPSLTFLDHLAKSMGTHLIAPRFAFLDESGFVEVKENVTDLVKWNISNGVAPIVWAGLGGTIPAAMGNGRVIKVTEPYENYLRLCNGFAQGTNVKMTEAKEKSKEIKIDASEFQYAQA